MVPYIISCLEWTEPMPFLSVLNLCETQALLKTNLLSPVAAPLPPSEASSQSLLIS